MIQKIFLFLVLLFSSIVYATDEKISLSIDNKIYNPHEEINLAFVLNSCSREFKVRPTVDIGSIEMYNPKTLTWISQNNSWEAFPYIEEKMKIRIADVMDRKILLGLELQNIKLGTVTRSDGVSLWISDAYKNYIDILNTGIATEASQSAW